jgi:hypothetical protein
MALSRSSHESTVAGVGTERQKDDERNNQWQTKKGIKVQIERR